ncbi:LysR family transcriptional regulator [Celerinatantimonas yamalensis]|uniref:LysR family transcriptional regulator n=1 Tax=Celerinatantimonas yamalensis TaxID=559956 RepID=A0ABW9G1T7_9GAMM
MDDFPLLELDLLRSFVAITQTGSFSKASEQVFRSPGAISMQIKRLEQLLDQQLFERSSRQVRLTEAGERLLQYAQQLLQLNQQAVNAFREPVVEQQINLGISSCIDSQYLSKVLSQCAETHPHLQIHVVVATSQELMQRLEAGTLDLAMIVSGNIGLGRQSGRVVYSESLVWAMCKEGRAYQKTPLPLALDSRGCLWRETALAALDETSFNYRVSYSSDQSEGVKAAVMADLAIAALPKSMLRDGLVEVPAVVGLPPLDQYQVILQTQPHISSAVCMLKDYIREIFQSNWV